MTLLCTLYSAIKFKKIIIDTPNYRGLKFKKTLSLMRGLKFGKNVNFSGVLGDGTILKLAKTLNNNNFASINANRLK